MFVDSSGTKQPGEACETLRDCALPKDGSVSCQIDYGTDGTPTQKCQVLRAGVAGSSPCAATRAGNLWISEGDFVPSGYFCDVASGIFCDGGSGACRPFLKPGEACSPNTAACGPSAYCDRDVSKCFARHATGETCDFDSCVDEDYCDADHKCAPALAAGASCTGDVECLSNSCVAGTCKADADASQEFLCGTP